MTLSKVTRAKYSALTHLSKAEAARELGVSTTAVIDASKRYGLVFNAEQGRKAALKGLKKGRAVAARKKAICSREDYQSATHLSRSAAAEVLGVTYATLCMAASRHGLIFAGDRLAHLRSMTSKQRSDYSVYRKSGFSKHDALAAMGIRSGAETPTEGLRGVLAP